MAKGLIWATAEDLTRNRGRVLSLYRQLLRSLNSPKLPLNLAARLAKKTEVRTIFMLGSEEQSLHNIADLIDAAEYSLSLLRKGEIPKYIQLTYEDCCHMRMILKGLGIRVDERDVSMHNGLREELNKLLGLGLMVVDCQGICEG
ncbi:hypothetical protein HHK36_028464 [Tetracentron sinense]|uniref:Uncharacterized protein n=1 Tax=Tetracentron sinense TaxID=13715 RepID=A0A834YFS3_TETSI|nr:hypothetical protein HHK36_028464 [Tetracentron sinense]